MKFEHSQLIADLEYILIILKNPDFELSEELLDQFLKRSNYMKKNVDKYIKSVNKAVKELESGSRF